VLHGMLSDVAGARVLRGAAVVDPAHPEHAGARLAEELRQEGADEILAGLRGEEGVPAPQPE